MGGEDIWKKGTAANYDGFHNVACESIRIIGGHGLNTLRY